MARLSERNKQLTLVPAPQSPSAAGFITETADDIIPTGWLECNGQAVSRTTYSELFALIGTTYGVGDGSTTFNLPTETSVYDAVNMTVIIKAFTDKAGVSIGVQDLTMSGDLTVDTDTLHVDSTNNRVGIGTTSPGSALHVTGDIFTIDNTGTTNTTPTSNSTTIQHNAASGLGTIMTYSSSGGTDLSVYTNSGGAAATEKLRIASTGYVGVGNTTPLSLLHVGDTGTTPRSITMILASDGTGGFGRDIRFRRAGVSDAVVISNANEDALNIIAGGSGGVRLTSGATSWVAVSDMTKKTAVENISNALSLLSGLSTFKFTYNNDINQRVHLGVSAQEVQPVLPELVEVDLEGTLSMNYTGLIPVLLKAIQELKAEIDLLKGA
jgi:microcystin-dependent protein